MISHRKHRLTGEPFRISAAFGRVGLLLLLFVGFWGSMVACGGDADRSDSRTPSVAADSSDVPPRQQRETLYAHGEVNVRSGPGGTHAVARTLARGDRIEVGAADARGWAPAYDSYGQRIGYVYRAGTRLRPYVPSPSSEPSHGTLSGPTAICRDGTDSYSAHRRGTCSGRGGVARWLRDVP